MIEHDEATTVGNLAAWQSGDIFSGVADNLTFRLDVAEQTDTGAPIVTVTLDPEASNNLPQRIEEFNQMELTGTLLGSSQAGIPKPLGADELADANSDPDHRTYIDDLRAGIIDPGAFLVIDPGDDEPFVLIPPLKQLTRL